MIVKSVFLCTLTTDEFDSFAMIKPPNKVKKRSSLIYEERFSFIYSIFLQILSLSKIFVIKNVKFP